MDWGSPSPGENKDLLYKPKFRSSPPLGVEGFQYKKRPG